MKPVEGARRRSPEKLVTVSADRPRKAAQLGGSGRVTEERRLPRRPVATRGYARLCNPEEPMKYVGHLEASNEATLTFEFEARDNDTAERHIADIVKEGIDRPEIEGGRWTEDPRGYVRACFRRVNAATLKPVSYARGRVGTNHHRPSTNCECGDPGCPMHEGRGHCRRRSNTALRRIDFAGEPVVKFCRRCADDALTSGVFAE